MPRYGDRPRSQIAVKAEDAHRARSWRTGTLACPRSRPSARRHRCLSSHAIRQQHRRGEQAAGAAERQVELRARPARGAEKGGDGARAARRVAQAAAIIAAAAWMPASVWYGVTSPRIARGTVSSSS